MVGEPRDPREALKAIKWVSLGVLALPFLLLILRRKK